MFLKIYFGDLPKVLLHSFFTLVSLPTGKWLLSYVSPFMSLDITSQIASFLHESWHYQIFTKLLSCVGLLMGLQITTHAECLVTFEGGKWLNSCWVMLCVFQLPLWLKVLSHFEQANGFSHVDSLWFLIITTFCARDVKWILTSVNSFKLFLITTYC